MSDEPLLPHRMTLLGKAMHPIWLKLKMQIEIPVSRIPDNRPARKFPEGRSALVLA